MTEQLRETYFLAIRTCLLLAIELYIVLSQSVLIGASGGVLLLLAFFLGTMTAKELVKQKRYKWILLGIAMVLCIIMIKELGTEFVLLGVLIGYEILSMTKLSLFWYFIPFAIAWVPSEIGIYIQLMFTLLIGMLYIQHDFIVASYLEQTKEDTMLEQRLKRNLYEQEHAHREEMKRGLLMAENQLLEERERISQTLHDKLYLSVRGNQADYGKRT